jgi:hypothetical protein
VPPASPASVSSMSTKSISPSTSPGGICPGQFASAANFVPPSWSGHLPSRSGAFEMGTHH